MKIGILGAGSWGTTLAALLAAKNNEVTLWEFDPGRAKDLSSKRRLSFFKYATLPKEVLVTNDLSEAVGGAELVVFAVPSHTLRDTARKILALGADLSGKMFVTAVKGIENESLKVMSEIITEELKGKIKALCALSGPTHAEEVAQQIPTTATIASRNSDAARLCQEIFTTPYFRVYTSSDIKGVETGAALKNIFAIAAGICDGLGLGDNTKSALVTRGLREMIKLGVKMGGSPHTFLGITGLGDLIVTCFSRHSRNRGIGEKLGSGQSLAEAQKSVIMVAEGVKTARSAYELSKKLNIELPIIEQIYLILYENKPPKKAVTELMTREMKPETIIEEFLNEQA
ncbi:MAG: NAD(P)-dependent glycerol-3-phosphate dehydrogenase [Endomicrobiales bacterium]|nr:NAD(P)-dependent glycerol-3-phosphate dehydrogenase [Endomicrobiales bacterium]